MSSIHTLIPDIQLLLKRKDGWFTDELAGEFSTDLASRLQEQMLYVPKKRLKLGQMGPKCPCALWHSIHKPELAEALPPWAEFKYMFGHMIEAMAITLAKAAGHEVTGEQDEVSVDGIIGRRDCVIDGCIVDVKSASSRGFNKFKSGSIREDDSFGYLDQLDGYLVGSLEDPLVRVKDKAYILGIDKQLGHMCLYEHHIRENRIRHTIKRSKDIVSLSSSPACECGTVPDGKSGNVRLDVKASYNQYKFCCNPNLRTFLYSDGPRYLTHVERKPEVTEVNQFGKTVYH